MAKKQVIAYFMHEYEQGAAYRLMGQVSGATESYLMGEVDDETIQKLRQEGLIVQVLDDQQGQLPGLVPKEAEEELQPSGVLGTPFEGPEVDLTRPNFYMIQLMGPLLEDRRSQLEALGVELLEYIPRNAYTAYLTVEQLVSVGGLPFVRGVRLYAAESTRPQLLLAFEQPGLPGGEVEAAERKTLTYDVRLHREQDREGVLKRLKDQGVDIVGASKRKIRLSLAEDSALAAEIAALPEVATMEEYVPPKLHNDVARALLGIDAAGANPGAAFPLAGADQIVAVADTGLDDQHPDFQGRIAGIVALGRRNSSNDPHGHGTHVAGSVLGDGAASGGQVRGTAPQAKLYFQSLLDSRGGLGGLPLDLEDLFEQAYQAGARIHNNSWGSATTSMYTVNSIEVDEFIARRRDMLIVISAGNEGQAEVRQHSQPGFVDWLSIDSPASCKNALTVGASRSSRTQGGYAALTYRNVGGGKFPDDPIGSETVSGNPQEMAAFSSRGPCDDRRIKPDVVAPGTDIVSTKSSRAPKRNFWGPYEGNKHYAYLGGTSMAAPLVSGCAALVREYYVKERGHEPSAALLKATLVNGTRWLTGADAVADHPRLPNYHQGFGCVYMPWTVPNPAQANLALDFIDTWKEAARQFVRSGQRLRLRFSIAGGEWLRICLTWTDLPARALQNNLNLFVQHLGSQQKWTGNIDLPMALMTPDPDNNVEVVRLENPQAGDYLIQITATNLLKGPQDFALVVSGHLTAGLVQV